MDYARIRTIQDLIPLPLASRQVVKLALAYQGMGPDGKWIL